MSHPSTPTLPPFDRKLLNLVQRLVPPAERAEWSRTWHAELWHMHHRNATRRVPARLLLADLSIGLTRDALWLRTESYRRTFAGTATLCIALLFGLIVVASVIALVPEAGWLNLTRGDQFLHYMLAAPLIVFVAFASASTHHVERGPQSHGRFWIKQVAFFCTKIVQVLLLAFALSLDLCQPLHAAFPATADFFQIFFFVVFALLGLRWAIHDQEQRCKHCLHSLAMPARVGRPSRNLLEWNGTELSCKHGHGLLSVPEMETSWCQSSRWVVLDAGWQQAVDI